MVFVFFSPFAIFSTQVWLTVLCFYVFWLLSFIVFLAAVWLLYSRVAAVLRLFSCLDAV